MLSNFDRSLVRSISRLFGSFFAARLLGGMFKDPNSALKRSVDGLEIILGAL